MLMFDTEDTSQELAPPAVPGDLVLPDKHADAGGKEFLPKDLLITGGDHETGFG